MNETLGEVYRGSENEWENDWSDESESVNVAVCDGGNGSKEGSFHGGKISDWLKMY